MSGPSSLTGEPLTGACVGCNRPDGILHPHRNEIICPRCSNYYDVCEMAHLNLEELVGPIIDTWTRFWTKRGLGDIEQNEILKQVAERDAPIWSYARVER
jgi:recombinational DNA repair protein (RecF pathway)